MNIKRKIPLYLCDVTPLFRRDRLLGSPEVEIGNNGRTKNVYLRFKAGIGIRGPGVTGSHRFEPRSRRLWIMRDISFSEESSSP